MTTVDGMQMSIDYEPGESRSGLFGGNSNWRGPIWFPVNVLLADALRSYSDYLGSDTLFHIDGVPVCVADAATDLETRLISLFRPGPDGRRPSDGAHVVGPLWTAHPTFSEYFHGDTGEGLGASHQTGWTAFVAHLLCRP